MMTHGRVNLTSRIPQRSFNSTKRRARRALLRWGRCSVLAHFALLRAQIMHVGGPPRIYCDISPPRPQPPRPPRKLIIYHTFPLHAIIGRTPKFVAVKSQRSSRPSLPQVRNILERCGFRTTRSTRGASALDSFVSFRVTVSLLKP